VSHCCLRVGAFVCLAISISHAQKRFEFHSRGAAGEMDQVLRVTTEGDVTRFECARTHTEYYPKKKLVEENYLMEFDSDHNLLNYEIRSGNEYAIVLRWKDGWTYSKDGNAVERITDTEIAEGKLTRASLILNFAHMGEFQALVDRVRPDKREAIVHVLVPMAGGSANVRIRRLRDTKAMLEQQQIPVSVLAADEPDGNAPDDQQTFWIDSEGYLLGMQSGSVTILRKGFAPPTA
jgi:hypothetical protein